MVHRLRIAAHVADRLASHHLAEGKAAESISLALGHAWTGSDGALTVVVADPQSVFLFSEECYEARGFAQATLRKDVRAAVCWHAVRNGYTAVVDIHDHHFAEVASFSTVDDRDDRRSAKYFSATVPGFMPESKTLHAAAVVIARRTWAARAVHAPGLKPLEPMRVDRVGLHDGQLSAPEAAEDRPEYSRQGVVIPRAAQRRLAHLTAAVVGAGGTGSIAVEALARIGVGRIVLVDGDRLEASNLNRLQGAGPSHVGRHKVHVLAEHLARVAPHCLVHPVPAHAHDAEAIAALESADFLIGCVDNEETRWWLNRFAVQYMVPWFDCGVLIRAATPPTMLSRAQVILPGAGPCGHCTPMEFFARQRPFQFQDATTLAAQRSAGYIVDHPAHVVDPSLYPLNMQAVSSLMLELLAWIGGTRPVCHTVLQASDSDRVERTVLASYGGGGAADCPLCGHLIGQCRDAELPRTESNESLQPKEVCHGTTED